ncbi:hypothetical protein NHQ30_005481 [Ciborinia camelliae]|nr:hypothetical protein NHQ30_005481 [Ciborinia camelliae]
MSARSVKLDGLAEERFKELMATGQSLEDLESMLRKELNSWSNVRTNPAQICKRVLSRIREARTVERATTFHHLPTPEISEGPTPEPHLHPAEELKKVVVLKPENGYFTPTPIPDAGVSDSSKSAKVKWSITKTNSDAYQTPAAEIFTKKRNSDAHQTPAAEIPTKKRKLDAYQSLAAEAPVTICSTTLEYLGTNLTLDQMHYNSLARRVGTKEIIEARIKRGMEESGEELEEATMRAHSLAECEVSRLAGYFADKERGGSEPAKKKKKRKVGL